MGLESLVDFRGLDPSRFFVVSLEDEAAVTLALDADVSVAVDAGVSVAGCWRKYTVSSVKGHRVACSTWKKPLTLMSSYGLPE